MIGELEFSGGVSMEEAVPEDLSCILFYEGSFVMMKKKSWKLLSASVCLAMLGIFSGGLQASAADAATASNTDNSAAVTEAPIYNLAEVVVNGRRYISGQYVAATGNVGILGEQDAMKSPVSTTTLSKKAINDFINPTEGLSGTLSLVPSVQYVGNPAVDQINIRGFADDGRGISINGVPGMTAMSRQFTNYVDTVDVIEGPSNGITGNSINAKTGGTVNINSKKAEEKPITNLGLAYYSKEGLEESVDVGRRFGTDNRYGVRINAMNVGGERGIDHWNLKQRDIYVNLDQKTKSSITNLLLGYSFTDSKGRPTPVTMAKTATKVPSAPSGDTNIDPSWRRDKYKQYTIILNHEQKINDNLSAYLNYGHYKEDWYYCLNADSYPSIDNNGDFKSLIFGLSPLLEKNDYFQVGLKEKFKTGALDHEIVVGFDKQWRDYKVSGITWDDLFSGSIYNPGSDGWLKPTGKLDADSFWFTHYKSYMTGWSIFDTIKALDNKMTVLVGAHKHIAKQIAYKVDGTQRSYNKADDVTPTFGINYEFSPRFAVYANHTEMFTTGALVPSGYVNTGDVLSPKSSKQNEVGFKFKTGNFVHKMSYFDIKQPSAVGHDFGDKKIYTYDGEARNKGFEYTAAGSLSDKWNLIGGFMWMNAKQEGTAFGLLDGKRSNGIPHWTGNIGLEYKANDDFSVLARANLIGNSQIWYSSTSARTIRGYNVPGYFRFDLGVNYKTEIGHLPVRFRAMCYNVTNTHYWQPQGTNLYIGSPRTYMLSAEFQF